MKDKLIFSLITVVIWIRCGHAQEQVVFEKLSIEKDISQSITYGVDQVVWGMSIKE